MTVEHTGQPLPASDVAVSLDHRFPDERQCEQANLNVTFHPKIEAEGMPCIEVGGVLVFAYLDPEAKAVSVSVDLDTADDQIVQPDGTVPVQIAVQGTEVWTGE